MPDSSTPNLPLSLTRRHLLGLLTASVPAVLGTRVRAAQQPAAAAIGSLDAAMLPAGVRSRCVENVNGLRMHVLEAGVAANLQVRQ